MVSAAAKKRAFCLEKNIPYLILKSMFFLAPVCRRPPLSVTIAHHWFRLFEEMNILALMRSCHILLTYISGIWALHILPIYPFSFGVFTYLGTWFLFWDSKRNTKKTCKLTEIAQQEKVSFSGIFSVSSKYGKRLQISQKAKTEQNFLLQIYTLQSMCLPWPGDNLVLCFQNNVILIF